MYRLNRRIQLVAICLFVLCGLHAQVQNHNDDILYWSQDHRLTFDDFKGKPSHEDTTVRKASPEMLTHKLGAIIKSIDVKFLSERGKTTFTIRAAMKENVSWLKDHGDTIELKHEQGHFDICEIYARILRRDIKMQNLFPKQKKFTSKLQ